MCGSLEEFKLSGYVRDSYPTYAEGLAAVTEDWETFLNNIPKLPDAYESLRAPAAWNLWSFLVGPFGLIKRNLLFMSRFGPASQWQHTYQAVAFGNNAEYGWDQMLVSFDHQSETGQLPDFYDDNRGNFATIRPPIQGWALKLMRRLGYYDKITTAQRAEFYPKLAAWANWFDKYRVEDGVDGLPHYEHSDESGMEDGSTFRESNNMVTPDLPAYLVLLYEELGEMAQEIGMEPSVKKAWYDKAAAAQKRLIDKLWNGECFVSHKMDGTEIQKDYGILGYLPVVLGNRLPKDILSKLIAGLKKENYILTEYGFDKEKLCARDLCDVACNSVRGYIYQPFNLVLISALYDCGEKEFAQNVARRFCDTMVNHFGLSGTLNSFTGATPGEWLSWNAGAYLLIAGFAK
jgi:putative isomerase